MRYTRNFIQLKTVYSNDYETEHEFNIAIEDIFVDGAKLPVRQGWSCIQSGRLKSGVKFYIFMREIAE